MRHFRRKVFLFLWMATMACFLWKLMSTQNEDNEATETEVNEEEFQKEIPWFMKKDPDVFPNLTRGVSSERPLWPEEDPDNDRIVNQLMHIPPNYLADQIEQMKTIITIGDLGIDLGRTAFQYCPVRTCEIINDNLNTRKTANALLIKGDETFPDRTDHPQDQLWILFQLESPPHSYDYSSYKDVINWTATYRRDSDLVAPYAKYVPYSSVDEIKHRNYRQKQERDYSLGKEKKVAWFVSNCGQRSGRMAYANELEKYIQVDTYGRCGRRQCPKSDNDHCLDLLDKRYKFYLSFENSICKDYVTEKFFTNALGHNVVPIVFGTTRKEYEKVAPLGSFIHVDDFSSPKALAEYLHLVDKNDTLYNEYFAWKGKGDFINTFFACRLCALLHSPLRPKSYPDLQKWWAGDETCKKPKTNETTI